LASKAMKPFIYMGYGVNNLMFGITGTEEPKILLHILPSIGIIFEF
jgi:hypothetical protein